MSTHFIIKSSL